jgi:hypothetical protein
MPISLSDLSAEEQSVMLDHFIAENAVLVQQVERLVAENTWLTSRINNELQQLRAVMQTLQLEIRSLEAAGMENNTHSP